MDPEAPTPDSVSADAAVGDDQDAATASPLSEVPVEIAIDIGRKLIPLAEVAELGIGSIVTFDRMVGEPVDLIANGRRVAAGEIIGVDGRFALRVTEIRRSEP